MTSAIAKLLVEIFAEILEAKDQRSRAEQTLGFLRRARQAEAEAQRRIKASQR